MSVEMTTYEIMNLLFLNGVQILELVDGREFLDVKTVGQDTIRFSFQEMLGLIGGDVGDGGEDIASVCSSSFYAVTMVNTALSSFCVHVKVLEIVVEVDRAGTEVTTEESGVGGEDGRDIHLSLLGQWKGDTREPFVEVSYHSDCGLTRNVL